MTVDVLGLVAHARAAQATASGRMGRSAGGSGASGSPLTAVKRLWHPRHQRTKRGEKLKTRKRTVMSEIQDIRAEYARNRFMFVDGKRVAEILCGLGATDADLEGLKVVSDALQGDPTLPFRRTRNGRFCLDMAERRIYRLQDQPFVLTADEDFVRHDSGMVRIFDPIQNDLQLNAALQALLIFKALVVDGIDTAQRPFLDYSATKWVCTLFNMRTITTPRILGEPAIEGVHSDGADHTMTTFFGGQNMTADSAVTYVHDSEEKNGTRWDAVDPALCCGKHRHSEFLDTLLLIDHEKKHSLSPVFTLHDDEVATRDMAVFFTRRPAMDGHASYPYDAIEAHVELPMVAGIPTQGS